MNFVFATIHVTDLATSIRFYEDVIGLKVMKRFTSGSGMEIAFMADGPTEIELLCHKQEKPKQYLPYPSFAFAVADLDQAMAEMKAKGVTITKGPIHPNPSTRFFFIQDPDGMPLQLIEQKG